MVFAVVAGLSGRCGPGVGGDGADAVALVFEDAEVLPAVLFAVVLCRGEDLGARDRVEVSVAEVLIVAPSLTGAPQAAVGVARSVTQISVLPTGPCRSEAKNRLNPSPESAGP